MLCAEIDLESQHIHEHTPFLICNEKAKNKQDKSLGESKRTGKWLRHESTGMRYDGTKLYPFFIVTPEHLFRRHVDKATVGL